jgi:hypothetical protein
MPTARLIRRFVVSAFLAGTPLDMSFADEADDAVAWPPVKAAPRPEVESAPVAQPVTPVQAAAVPKHPDAASMSGWLAWRRSRLPLPYRPRRLTVKSLPRRAVRQVRNLLPWPTPPRHFPLFQRRGRTPRPWPWRCRRPAW